MAFVLSPSNMATYRQCPLRFYGQTILKAMPWKETASKVRGTAVHSWLERVVKQGSLEGVALDELIDADYVRRSLYALSEYQHNGYTVFTEKELAMTKQGKSCGWWDETAFLRAKADVLCIPEDVSQPAILGDWKTGRKWDSDAFQLRVEAILIHILYGVTKVKCNYWYVDQGETVEETVDFTHTLADVQDIYDLMREMKLAIRDKNFAPTPNKFCKWCDWHQTEHCR